MELLSSSFRNHFENKPYIFHYSRAGWYNFERLPQTIKWDASDWWSFRPNFAWGSIRTMTIRKTHPTLFYVDRFGSDHLVTSDHQLNKVGGRGVFRNFTNVHMFCLTAMVLKCIKDKLYTDSNCSQASNNYSSRRVSRSKIISLCGWLKSSRVTRLTLIDPIWPWPRLSYLTQYCSQNWYSTVHVAFLPLTSLSHIIMIHINES